MINTILFNTVSLFATLFPLSIAALVTEYTGTLNIAVEGTVLLCCFVCASFSTVNIPLAIFATIIFGVLFSFFVNKYSSKFKADFFIIGLGINLLAPAITSISSMLIFNTKSVFVIPEIKAERIFSSLQDIPIIGFLFGQRISVYLIILSSAILLTLVEKTPLHSVFITLGAKSDALRLAGLVPEKIKSKAFIISGLACSLGAIALTSDAGAWIPNMSSNRGWMALVVVYLGQKKAFGTILASLFFVLIISIANSAQAFSVIPVEVLESLPYFIAIIVLFIMQKKKHTK